jgi:tetratricopeptide (TPR) repeat protein
MYQQALVAFGNASAPQAEALASGYKGLGDVLTSQGQYGDAELRYLKSLELVKKVVGEDHPATGHTLMAMAELFTAEGAHAKAERYYQRALANLQETLGGDHPDLAKGFDNCARSLRAAGRARDADAAAARAKTIRASADGGGQLTPWSVP